MSFIGNVPAEAYAPVAKDTFSGNGSTTDFTLSIPATTNSVNVYVENVAQEPTDAYTIAGTTLSFTAAPVSGTDNIYVIHRGPAVQQVVPPAGVAIDASSVTASGNLSVTGTSTLTGNVTASGDVSIADKIIHTGDTNTAIRFPAADTVTVETGGSERVRVDSSGNCFIDRTSSIDGNSAVLSVGGGDESAINAYRNTSSDGAGVFNWYSDVGGSETRVGQLEANGDIETTTGSYGSFSDQRLKQDIVDSGSQWDDIKALQVKKYRLIKSVEADGDSAPTMLGVIAQDLEAAGMNGLVKDKVNETTGEEYKSVKYSILYMKAVKALQEAMDRIETLEAEVAALKETP